MASSSEHGLITSEIANCTLEDLGLVDADPPEAFDALTRLATRVLRAPVALISIVEETKDRQYFTSHQGLPEPWATERQTPLSHSFCQYVKKEGKPLVVCNASEHPLVGNNLAIRDLGVIAYLGVPIIGPNGSALGALCVIEGCEREWTDDDQAVLADLAKCVNDEILLRAALKTNRATQERTKRYNAMRESVALSFMVPDLAAEDRFKQLLRAGCASLGIDSGAIAKVDGDQAELLYCVGPAYQSVQSLNSGFATSFARAVVAGHEQIHFPYLDTGNVNERRALNGRVPGCYAGAPLIFDGVVYGVLEFCGATQRCVQWTEEELSILSMISMFACANLGIIGQISTLRKSKAALVEHLMEIRHNAHKSLVPNDH